MLTTLDKESVSGLTTEEVNQRLTQFGKNEIPEERRHPLLIFFRKLWGPVPWMLEATLIFQLALGKPLDALITTSLLLVNAVISFFHENDAQAALAALRQKLIVQARVRRDGRWQLLPAQELVPG